MIRSQYRDDMSNATPGRAQQSLTRGFLFADLRGYSAFTDEHGDAAARELLGRYRSAVRDVIARYGGAEIRTEGDSFYVVFISVSDAVEAGLAILESAATSGREAASPPIRVGMGVHAGETVDSAEGIVSAAVNTAARICSAAAAGELLVSDTVRALTRTHLEVHFVSRGRRRLKGISEPMSLYRVQPLGRPAVRIGPVGRLTQRWRSKAPIVAGALALTLVATVIGAALLREGFGGTDADALNGASSSANPDALDPGVPPPGTIAFSRTNLVDYGSQIHSITTDGSGDMQLTNADAFTAPGSPIWRPDGALLAFGQNVESQTGDAHYELYTMQPDGTDVRQVTRLERLLIDPDWAPDGASVAVTLPNEAGLQLRVAAGEIGIVNMEDGGLRVLPLPTDGFARDPSWSPDGSQLLFLLDTSSVLDDRFVEPGDTEFWVVDVASGDGRQIFSVDAQYAVLSAAWSPGSNDIAFVREDSGGSDIFVMNSAGTGLRQLTDHPAIDAEPAWSPDGEWIVFVSHRDFQAELYVMDADGESTTRLTEGDQETLHSSPDWGPP